MLHIAIWHPKGGVGKTTLALHLAACLHSQGARVGLGNVDPQGSLEWLIKTAPENFEFPVARGIPSGKLELDAFITDYPARDDPLPRHGVVVLPSGAVAHELATLDSSWRKLNHPGYIRIPVITRYNKQRASQQTALMQQAWPWAWAA